MQRSDWLLALLWISPSDETKGKALDTIRIMKGLFIFAHESEASLENFYDFIPYLYGPCSFEVYDDLEEMERKGLVEKNWPYYRSYRLTSEGEAKAKEIWESLSSATQEKLKEVKDKVNSFKFSDLLKYVYERWPKFASQSILSPLRR